MHIIDLFILIMLIWAVIRGFTRGLIKQLTILAALILGIYGALKLSGLTAEYMQDRIKTDIEHLYLIAVGVTFVIVFIGIYILGNLIQKITESLELSLINRLLGILFSVGRTVIITGLILAYADRIDQQIKILPENTREESFFFRPFTSIAHSLFNIIEKEELNMHENLQDIVKQNGSEYIIPFGS